MKTKLLKRLTKRFYWIYDHKNKEWVVVPHSSQMFYLKPLKDYTYAECMASMEIGSRYVSSRRTWQIVNSVYRKIETLNKEVKIVEYIIK